MVVTGLTVKNRQDETLGKVADLALQAESGRIVALMSNLCRRRRRGLRECEVGLHPIVNDDLEA